MNNNVLPPFLYIFSAPGRTEIAGNHTDHQHGCVIAAAVNLEAVAEVVLNDTDTVRINSEGYPDIEISLCDLDKKEKEKNTTAALVRGVLAAFAQKGAQLKGFDANIKSTVLAGSGLSSSAAFEVLMGTICNELFFDGRLFPAEIAKIGQWTENTYFGKPCGLMDQMASSVGSFITIDFKNPAEPVINKVEFDFASCGHALCIVDTGGSHADLTDDYAAVRGEMESAAGVFGKDVLRDVDENEFMANIRQVRESCGDRAVLRAVHFYNENKRAVAEVEALTNNDFEAFKEIVVESGRSSYMYNQNVYTTKAPQEQGLSVSLLLCEEMLKGKGAWRVHGGGFAGTIQAFVPNDMLEQFRSTIEAVYGEGTCHVLSIRPFGGIKLY